MNSPLGLATGRFGDARFFTSCEKAARFVGPLDILSPGLLHTLLTTPSRTLASDSSINLKINLQFLFRARVTPQSSPRVSTLGLGERRDAEKARTDERSHGWRSEEAEQQERSRMRSDERLRGVTSLAEGGRR
jgi:hypothetical protein